MLRTLWTLALSRWLTERQSPRSDALPSAVAIGSPVSSRTWVIHWWPGRWFYIWRRLFPYPIFGMHFRAVRLTYGVSRKKRIGGWYRLRIWYLLINCHAVWVCYPGLSASHDLSAQFSRPQTNQLRSGSRFNINIPSFRYGDFHCREKTVVRPSFLTIGIAILRKDGLYIERGPWSLSALVSLVLVTDKNRLHQAQAGHKA